MSTKFSTPFQRKKTQFFSKGQNSVYLGIGVRRVISCQFCSLGGNFNTKLQILKKLLNNLHIISATVFNNTGLIHGGE